MLGLSRRVVERTAPALTWDQYLRIYTEGMTTGGAPSVSSVDQALRNSAFWAAVFIKAKGVAGLPGDVVRSVGGVRTPVTAPPVVARPSGIVGPRVWRFQLAWSMFTDGNTFGDIVAFDSRGRPQQIELVDPTSVTQRSVDNGFPTVTIGGSRRRLWPHGDVWHVPGEMVAAGSPFALSPVTYAARSIGTSLAAEDFGGAFFSEGAIPSAILSPLSDPGDEGAKRLKEKFMAAVRGSREPVVLPRDTKYERIQVAPSDSQFLDLMRYEVEQVARFTGVPPAMLFSTISGQNVTYANVTDSDLWYLKHTLSWPIDIVEECISDLLPAPQIYRMNRDAILRADTLKRYEAHETALKNRWRTVNEVRRLEDEPPFDGPEYDEPGVPSMPSTDPADESDADAPSPQE